MKMDAKQGRSRGLSSPALPLTRGGTFSDSNKGSSPLSHSLAQITHFMSTSFPHRGKRDEKSTPSPEVTTLKEEFERKIAAVVFCLEEKAEENIDLSYKLKALQQTSRQIESNKDREIEELQRALKAKEEEITQLEKKTTDDELKELNRRIQTITHCLNDMAEENLRLRTLVNQNTNNNANGKSGNRLNRGSTGSPFSPHQSSSSFSMDPEPSSSSSASFLSALTASSSILSASKSSSSTTPSTSAPSTQTQTLSPPLKAGTANTSTNTSPVPTPAQAPAISVVSLPSAVADMKSEVLAEELLKDPDWLKRFCASYLVPPPASQSLALLGDIIKQDKSRSEAKVKQALDDRIKELETSLQALQDSTGTLRGKLAVESDRTGSLADSVAEYERKLKELEGRMWDNLNKEAQRRSDAESKAKRLKKKVDELQFLLDELKDDGSDEDEEDDNEEATPSAAPSEPESPSSSSTDDEPTSSPTDEPKEEESKEQSGDS